MSNNLRKFICSYFPSVVPNKFHDYITLLKSQRIYTNDLAIIVRKKTVLNNNIQGCVVVPNRATIKTYVSRCRRMNPRIRPSKCTRRYEWWNMWSLEYTVAQATYVRPGDNNDITVAVTFTLCIRRAGIRLILVQCEHNFKWRMYHSTAAAAALYALRSSVYFSQYARFDERKQKEFQRKEMEQSVHKSIVHVNNGLRATFVRVTKSLIECVGRGQSGSLLLKSLNESL